MVSGVRYDRDLKLYPLTPYYWVFFGCMNVVSPRQPRARASIRRIIASSLRTIADSDTLAGAEVRLAWGYNTEGVYSCPHLGVVIWAGFLAFSTGTLVYLIVSK
ncbi:hypothetical protein BO71DRAFT_30110 [Aspergillus ellipticus CBS 707.79]|uniref:Uncharacterized protein n=1 Tax=Aspergillus ellipticus CBS 707.79 TaxID=1448320 RepID=A0A319DD36_9EURO|nr:hypothetical protein BO71DRAFT_30110 [Aspergillus ellipticus CBS 707.79]